MTVVKLFSRFIGIAAVALVAGSLTLTACSGCEGSPGDAAADAADVDQQADPENEANEENTGDNQAQSDAGAAPDSDATPTAATDESATISEKPPLEIDGLLTSDDVGSLADDQSFTTADLPGTDPTPTYNAVRFKPTDSDDYGAGLQVWSFSDKQGATSRYERLNSQYLDVSQPGDDIDVPGSNAFVSDRGGILQFVVKLDEPPHVIAVSCSPSLCESAGDAAELATKVADRIREDHSSDASSN